MLGSDRAVMVRSADRMEESKAGREGEGSEESIDRRESSGVVVDDELSERMGKPTYCYRQTHLSTKENYIPGCLRSTANL